ncbi:hypothetical protein KBD87_04920 [Candidatus Saccharibacteria bacterium]|nr:hypothetical protein [Candidatus Saccharibacteria bacterium]
MRPIRTIIFLLVCIGLLVVAFLLIKNIFTTSTVPPTSEIKLTSYARSGTSAQYFVDGPIVANQSHRAMRISIDAETSKIELIDGYNNTVIRQDVFPNTVESYRAFLAGLETLGFDNGIKDSKSTEAGKCPLRKRYVYSMTNGSSQVFRYWSTSCGKGTSGAQVASVQTLFRRQIPSAVYNDVYRQFEVDN